VSTNPAQAPECQPQAMTALSGAPEAAAQRLNTDSPANQHVNDRARPARRGNEAAELASAPAMDPGDASEAAPIALSCPDLLPSTRGLLSSQQQEAEQRSLVLGAFWSEQAEQDLEAIVTAPAVRDQLRYNAEEILHDILSEWRSRCVDVGDAGSAGEVMWHRGVAHDHEWLPEQANGPEDYFLFYQRLTSGSGFEILAVRSIYQAARRWERRSRSPLMRPIRSLKRRLPWGLRR
jgi:hypothetical protein